MDTQKSPISKTKTSTMVCDDNDRNKITIFTIGSKVEIRSDDPGFEGAWYVAKLLDVNVHNPKTKNENGFMVKYDSLFEDDDINEKLTEVVDGKFLRPLPPTEYNGGDGFELGDVVDAYYRDGWWIGVVVKRVMKDNDDKYVVCFKSPYEQVEFEKFQLRIHVDWVDSCWKILPNKMHKKLIKVKKFKTSTMADDHDNDANKITIFTIGSKVEISSDEPGFYGAWYVVTLLDVNVHNPKTNNNNGFLVKYDTLFEDDDINEKLTEIADGKYLRPLPPPEYNGDDGFEVGDVIDAYYRDGWWIGVVVKKVMKDNDDKYVICFKSPYEEVEFEKFQLRIHVDWIDSCWKILPKKMHKTIIKTPKKLKVATKNVAQSSKGPGDSAHISSHSTEKCTHSQKRVETNSEQIGAMDGSVPSNIKRVVDSNSNSNSHGERSQSSTAVENLGSNGIKKLMVPVTEKNGSIAINPELPAVEHGAITTMDYKTHVGSVKHGGGKTKDESQMPEPLEDDESWPLTYKPYFIEVLRPKNVAKSFLLEIPPEVSDKLPTNSVSAQLLYRGNTWNLNLGDQKPKKKVEKQGWTKFVTDNNLKTGDVCVFELMDCTSNNLVKFRVQILKNDFPSELRDKAEGANKDNPIEILY